MKRYDLVVIGAGPAGLSAGIEAADAGMSAVVYDENAKPGGQLFKQIHKFFGSKEHKAKIRGFNIGKELLEKAEQSGVEVHLNAQVSGIHDYHGLSIVEDEKINFVKGSNIIIATGASENMIPFEGWTLPGVIGAGAAQTMVNLHRVLPGKKVLMVGSGNVGLVVSYQLKQAGMDVVAVIDAAPRIGGYGVHASKLARLGVPFYLSHTITKAVGEECVEAAIISEVDEKFQPIPGTEQRIEVDTICMAVGLSPMSKLARMAGCKMVDRGGLVPECDTYGQTSIPGIFAAGDVAGIEEASSAMINGRITGVASAMRAGYISSKKGKMKIAELSRSLEQLRGGMFAHENRGRTELTVTDEGIALSQNILKKGYLLEEEAKRFTGSSQNAGVYPVIECTQNIPCNPCQDACKFGCIQVGKTITSLPVVDSKADCKNCGMCVASCSGQAIFLIDETAEGEYVNITIPYEFSPLPEKGAMGKALDRSGKEICDAKVVACKVIPAYDHTALLTMQVPEEYKMKVRFYKKSVMETLCSDMDR